ncbi:hypothetical protein ETAA8_67900 [Anatilimnocola aggregata]|uniref:Lipoprotein n=1 Tax=Anatilimnocola aggregata TaxID=2528021 RepID=A0A517YN21_9BACT|nr:hypothetical protein [Anatilimnocola aggregata]QDU31630.1 hypothetical protein ETAA8_67900 [Anatilimnocola aggregata]
MQRLVQLSTFSLLASGLLLVAGCARSVEPNAYTRAANVESLRKAFGAGGTAEVGPAAAVAEPTGWATIKGKFVLQGQDPGRTPLKVDKDQAVCAPGGKQVYDEALVVDPNTKGIRDVVIYLSKKIPSDEKWEHADYLATKTAEVEPPFDQKNCVFLSHVFVMRSTQKVLIKNSDPIGHNTSISPSAGSKAASINVIIGANDSTMYEPKGESSIPNPVACTIHPWMSARLLTRSNPYFAVTAPDGTFEIKNVPAGVELEFAVWQEAAGFLSKASVNGTEEKWTKGRFKRTLANDATEEMNVTLDVSQFVK